MAINFASSGQQEILWLLNFMYVLMLREEDVFLIIEEPLYYAGVLAEGGQAKEVYKVLNKNYIIRKSRD